jgi:hypothetical protein
MTLSYNYGNPAPHDISLHWTNSDCNRATLDSKVNLRKLRESKTGTIALRGKAFTKILASDKERWPKVVAPNSMALACLACWICFSFWHAGSDSPDNELGGIFSAIGEIVLIGAPSGFYEKLKREALAIIRRFQDFPGFDPNQVDDLDSVERWSLQFASDKCKDRQHFLGLVSCWMADYILFSTSSGHFGKTTGYVEQGDTIALLAGSNLPLILRQEGDNWRYIGAAYIQDIMNWEAWPRDTNTDDVETFVLI